MNRRAEDRAQDLEQRQAEARRIILEAAVEDEHAPVGTSFLWATLDKLYRKLGGLSDLQHAAAVAKLVEEIKHV